MMMITRIGLSYHRELLIIGLEILQIPDQLQKKGVPRYYLYPQEIKIGYEQNYFVRGNIYSFGSPTYVFVLAFKNIANHPAIKTKRKASAKMTDNNNNISGHLLNLYQGANPAVSSSPPAYDPIVVDENNVA